MAYWEIVTRSFKITWRFKYLWLLALFSGEAGGGANFNYSFTQPITSGSQVPSLPDLEGRVTDWLGAHIGLVKRPGRVLLVWLLSIAVSLGLGVCTGLALAVLAVPAVILGIAVYASGSSAFWLVVVLSILVILPVALIVSAFVAAQSSSYWTLAFRRLEIDQSPGHGYAQPAPPQAAG